MYKYVLQMCKSSPGGGGKTLDHKSPIKMLGVFWGIFRYLFWGPKKKI